MPLRSYKLVIVMMECAGWMVVQRFPWWVGIIDHFGGWTDE
jgi:hypothetical protein